VRSVGIEVAGVFGENPFEVTLAEDEDVIEALAADAAQEALADRVRSWSSDGSAEDACPVCGGHPVEERTELAVAIPKEEPRTLSVGRRVAQLLRDPRPKHHAGSG
jgi:hypothetical protein